MIRLVLGGEKSGKSDAAYAAFLDAPGQGVVLAMGRAADQHFRAQILRHRQRRTPEVPLREPGLELAAALEGAAREGRKALVDSLDFWLFACLESGQDRTPELLESLRPFAGADAPACLLVSCEAGLGPLAATPLTRRFIRAQGALNQKIAALSDEVLLVVAGLPLRLK